MFVTPEAQRSYDAITSITKQVESNSLLPPPPVIDVKDPKIVVDVLKAFFDGKTVERFVTLASMDRECDNLSVAQCLLDTVSMIAMPRPRFEDLKITAEQKHEAEARYRKCQIAMQQLTQLLFSYNANLLASRPIKSVDILQCLAGLLIGYLNKMPATVV